MNSTLVVTGIHKEELEFGDQVVGKLKHVNVDIMRIPEGITHDRAGLGEGFYYHTMHQEIYLQLLQQVKDRYDLLIDLHCGLNDSGRCADVYTSHTSMLGCLAETIDPADDNRQLRLVNILSKSDRELEASHGVDANALTLIPERLWNSQVMTYVGLEIYLPKEGLGEQGDWAYARKLIECVISCHKRIKEKNDDNKTTIGV